MLFEINTSALSSHRKLMSKTFHSAVSVEDILESLHELGFSFRIRIFDPLTTLFAFLTQVFSADSSCRNAVASVIAFRQAQKLPVCCLNTGSLSKAKARLPLAWFSMIARKAAISSDSCWKHGRVIVVDGTGVSMPDTAANRKVFPLRKSNPHGFPIARMVALFSLSSGSLLDLAIGAMKGKGTGETSLFMQIWSHLKPGDTLLGDCMFSSYGILSRATREGVHVVTELRKSRSWRLKPNLNDQVIELKKEPKRPKHIPEGQYALWPDVIKVRVVKLKCAPKGFRPKIKYILTTLIDQKLTTAEDLLELYKRRWQVELNLRSIKTTLGMDILRGLTPEMVIKEIWVHVLAYNLIRTAMYAAGRLKKIPPMTISFKGAQQLMSMARIGSSLGVSAAKGFCDSILEMISTQIVGTRPDRYEPRVLKRRKKNFTLMRESRISAKRRLHKKPK